MRWGLSVVVRESNHSSGPLRLALWCPHTVGGEERGGGVDCRGRGGIPVLPEEVDARSVFPLIAGHSDVGLRNPVTRMQRWMDRTTVIITLLFTYPQVREY